MRLTVSFVRLSTNALPIVAKVFELLWQLMMNESEKTLLEVEEETSTWSILIGIHVERGSKFLMAGFKRLEVVGLQECGTWNGDCLASRGKHCPTVAGSFCDVEGLVGSE